MEEEEEEEKGSEAQKLPRSESCPFLFIADLGPVLCCSTLSWVLFCIFRHRNWVLSCAVPPQSLVPGCVVLCTAGMFCDVLSSQFSGFCPVLFL